MTYGKYYLKELEAAEGYHKLEGYLEFDISEKTYTKTILIIKNKKKSPSNIPSIGDLGYKNT